MAAIGVLTGGIGGHILAKLVGSYVMDIRMPSLLPVIVSAVVLLSAAVVASSAWPASRAARIDVPRKPSAPIEACRQTPCNGHGHRCAPCPHDINSCRPPGFDF